MPTFCELISMRTKDIFFITAVPVLFTDIPSLYRLTEVNSKTKIGKSESEQALLMRLFCEQYLKKFHVGRNVSIRRK